MSDMLEPVVLPSKEECLHILMNNIDRMLDIWAVAGRLDYAIGQVDGAWQQMRLVLERDKDAVDHH